MALSVPECEDILYRYLDEYPGFRSLGYVIKPTAGDIYGHAAGQSLEKLAGSYHPDRGIVAIVATRMHTEKELRRTLRHELHGHYGLNTFQPVEKINLLDNIVRLSKSSVNHNAQSFFKSVRDLYPDLHDHMFAEEIFSMLSEYKVKPEDCFGDYRYALQPDAEITVADIALVINEIEQGMQQGRRHQLTFPDAHGRIDLSPQDISPRACGAACSRGTYAHPNGFARRVPVDPELGV